MGIKKGLRVGLAENYKIKIGMKGAERQKKSGDGTYQMPVRLDYFRLCKTHRGKDGNYVVAKELVDAYGLEPKMLECSVPFDDIDLIFPTEYAYYNGKKKICFGDGEHATRTKSEGKVERVECNTETCPYLMDKRCKPSGRLHLVLTKAPRLGSVAVFRTHGWNSVSNILNSLEQISEQTGGILRGIPMRLEVLTKDTAEFGPIQHVNLETAAIDWDSVAGARMKELESRHRMKEDIKLIEATAIIEGILVDKDDPADVEDEFYGAGKKAFAAEPSEVIAAQVLGVETEKAPSGQTADPMPDPTTVEGEIVKKKLCGCGKGFESEPEATAGICFDCFKKKEAALNKRLAARAEMREKAKDAVIAEADIEVPVVKIKADPATPENEAAAKAKVKAVIVKPAIEVPVAEADSKAAYLKEATKDHDNIVALAEMTQRAALGDVTKKDKPPRKCDCGKPMREDQDICDGCFDLAEQCAIVDEKKKAAKAAAAKVEKARKAAELKKAQAANASADKAQGKAAAEAPKEEKFCGKCAFLGFYKDGDNKRQPCPYCNSPAPAPEASTDGICRDCKKNQLISKSEVMSKLCTTCLEKRRAGAQQSLPTTSREDDASTVLEGDSF